MRGFFTRNAAFFGWLTHNLTSAVQEKNKQALYSDDSQYTNNYRMIVPINSGKAFLIDTAVNGNDELIQINSGFFFVFIYAMEGQNFYECL